MFKLGYGNKILISHDICSKTRLHEWGGHGYGHIIRNIIPLMKNYGITNDQIDQLIRINPINLLSISNIN
jgi:phosphotriesterase-related protein